jgi:predicted transcriptional regulator
MSGDVSMSTRVPAELAKQIEELAEATHRKRSWIVQEALRRYVQEQAWQVRAIQEALHDYRSGDATLIPHEQIDAEMEAEIAALDAEVRATVKRE